MARPLLPPLPALPLRRTARRARRSLALRWSAVALAAGLAAAQAVRLGADAEAARAAWGDPVEVVVAARDLDAGDVVQAADVRTERWPSAVVPGGAVDEAPLGRVLSADVVAGEALVGARLAPDGLSGPAALVPDGWRAVAVPSSAGFGAPVPPLRLGDRVDVLAPDLVAAGAVVVAVDDEVVTIAVSADDAPAVAEAMAVAVVVLALRGAA